MTVQLSYRAVRIKDSDLSLSDIYGEKVTLPQSGVSGLANGHVPSADTRSVIRLSLRDALREYGPINDMAFTLSRNGVSFFFQSTTTFR
jgi:hypothetical protein